MSTTKLTRQYHCWNDCKMEGCPGHEAKLEFQSVTDALKLEDGKGQEFYIQTPELDAFLDMLKELSHSRVEIKLPKDETESEADDNPH